MLKIARFFKHLLPYMLVGVVLLFGQAMLDLNLPNMMSEIVDIGISRGGIEEIAPRALPQDAYGLLTKFMGEDDRAAFDAVYTPYSEASSALQGEAGKTFPGAAGADAYLRSAQSDAADTAMGHAGAALSAFMADAAARQGGEMAQSDAVSADFDFEAIRAFLPQLLAMPSEAIQPYIEQAGQTAALLSGSVAAALNKAFYSDLGADTGAIQTAYILRIGLIMVVLSLAMVACAVGAGYCFAKMGAGVARALRRDIFRKVSDFSSAEMDKFSTASLITRTTNDVTQVQMFSTMGMRMMVYAPVMGVGGIIMALSKSTGMSVIIAVAVGILLLMIGILMIFVMPKFKIMQKLLDRLNLVARENLSGIMVVRAFSNQKFQEKRFEDANRAYTRNSLFVGRALNLMMPLMMLVMNGVVLFIVWLGADQIANSAIQVGDLMAFMQYAMQAIMSFLFITMVFFMLPRASVSAGRINEVLQSEPAIKDPAQPKTLGKRAKGVVQFSNVCFKYGEAEENVLSDISFTAQPGQTTAFIGSTGSGKTTLVNLIPRFYDVTGGSVSLDGVDVRELTQRELRGYIGYVPQKGLLFSGDINSNLRFGSEDATGGTLREAAEVAQATEFIDKLDNGFESEISQGGTNVSGGQRQRLSIARALVKKAPVYIFDDSFSALDFATDAQLRAALKPYTKDAAVLIVAQRISTIMTAEQIIVLDDGKMAGKGTHQELMQNCPAYREIAQSQLSEEELA